MFQNITQIVKSKLFLKIPNGVKHEAESIRREAKSEAQQWWHYLTVKNYQHC